MTKPMSAPMLIRCLSGELFAHPEMIVEAIKQDPDTLALVREYGAGRVEYEEVLNAVCAIC